MSLVGHTCLGCAYRFAFSKKGGKNICISATNKAGNADLESSKFCQFSDAFKICFYFVNLTTDFLCF